MMFHIPPQNGGRIVEVAYAAKDGKVFRRTFDQSDRTTVYHVSAQLMDDECDYWQREPRNQRWRKMTRKEREAYALV